MESPPSLEDVQESTGEHTPVESPESILQQRKHEFEQARDGYSAAVRALELIKQRVTEVGEIYYRWQTKLERLVYHRDGLNQDLRERRKEIGTLEKELQSAKTDLEELEENANKVRREVRRARRQAKAASLNYETANSEQFEAEQALEIAHNKLKTAQRAFQLAGGKLSVEDIAIEQKPVRNNPWISGSFYLVTAVVMITLIAVVSMQVPWYILPIVLFAGLLVLVIIGALQLRSDEGLSQENFLQLMVEVFKRLPLLRGKTLSDGSSVTQRAGESESEGD